MRRLLSSCFVAALLAAFAFSSPALAEDEPQPNDIRDKVKAQMEKILELMKQNQDALLALSANRKAEPKPVDAGIELPPEGKAKQPEASAAKKGAEAAKEIEKLLRTTASEGRRIPGEIKKLLEMIPT
ncbi:MAG: hypothetical protein QNJ98_13640 [Planctomycetota bacterium]|nr:hypothetical protein [Planctomycetota bacterium]